MRTFIFSCALLLAFAATAHTKLLTADQVREPQSLLPYCSWLLDPEGRQTIDTVTSGSLQERFAPLSEGIPLKGAGPVWLRLVILKSQAANAATPPSETSRLVVNMGQLPPGSSQIFFSTAPGPVTAPGVWHGEDLASYSDVLLPEPGLLPLSVYVRMDEMPGLWFSPVVSAQSSARPDVLPSSLILPGLLILGAIACLLRAIAEQAQWALWSAIFLLAALAQAVLPLPGANQGFGFADLPALLAPGMTLVLLPHIGRCMFRTDKGSFLQDGILYLCSLLGVAVALLPLLPSMGWLTRLFPLAPLLLAPLLPLCIGALAAKRPGALAFSGAVVMPLFGACFALYALHAPSLHPLIFQGGLWGLAVGGIGLALARIPKTDARTEASASKNAGLLLAESSAAPKPAAAFNGRSQPTAAFSGRSQYDELPPLAVTPLQGLAGKAGPLRMDISELAPPPPPPPPLGPGADMRDSAATEQDARAEQAAAPGPKGPEPAQAGQPFIKGRLLPEFAGTSDSVESLATPGQGHEGEFTPSENAFVFNLHSLVREVHDIIAPLAKAKGLLFSWYIAPSLPSLLEGDAPRLRGALSLLLQNAVQATRQGAVQLAVRKSPDAEEPGVLLFAIVDNGSAQRTDAGFFHAWDLAAKTGGAFAVEYSPSSGTQISFSVRFALPSEAAAMEHMARHARPGGLYTDQDPLAEQFDDDEPMPVLHTIHAFAQGEPEARTGAESSAPHAAWPAEDPRQAAMSPEQVLAEQDFLASAPEAEEGAAVAEPTGEEGDLLAAQAQDQATQAVHTAPGQAETLAEQPEVFVEQAEALAGQDEPDAAPQDEPAEQARPDAEAEAETEERAAVAEPAGEKGDPLAAQAEEQAAQAVHTAPGQAETLAEQPEALAAQAEVFVEQAEPDAAPQDEPAEAEERAAMAEPAGEESDPLAAQAQDQAAQAVHAAPGQAETFVEQAEALAGQDEPDVAPQPDDADGEPTAPLPCIVVAETTTSNRRLLAHYLSDVPHEHRNASSNADVLDLFHKRRASLFIFDGDMPEADIVKTIGEIRWEERSANLAPTPVLVLSNHEAQSERLLEAGATYALVKPFQREALREIAAQAAPALAGKTAGAPATAPSPLPDAGAPRPEGQEVPVADAPQRPTPARPAARPVGIAHEGAVSAQDMFLDPRLAFTRKSDRTAPASMPLSSSITAEQWDTVSLGKPLAPASDPAQEVDLLEAALRDAPVQQGKPITVELPPRDLNFGASQAPVRRRPQPSPTAKPEKKPYGDAAAAAPMLRDLSAEDVTPQPQPEQKRPLPAAQIRIVSPPVVTPRAERPAPDAPAPSKAAAPERAEKPAPSNVSEGAPAAFTPEPDQFLSESPQAQPPATFPLPGIEGESLEISVLPLAPGIIHALKDALKDIEDALGKGSTVLIEEATGRLAGKAEHFGLGKLGKIARCVERAAQAGDLQATQTLLEDLNPVTLRYVDALQECFDSFLHPSR